MEDKIMAYGVFMGKRFKPKQKERFINGLGNEFAQMGYTVRLMKDDEIAALHGLTAENVRQIRSRAKKKLLERLKEA